MTTQDMFRQLMLQITQLSTQVNTQQGIIEGLQQGRLNPRDPVDKTTQPGATESQGDESMNDTDSQQHQTCSPVSLMQQGLA